MKATLAAAENGDGPVQTEEQIVGALVSKKSTVVLHENTENGSVHERDNQNVTFNDELNGIIEELRAKLIDYENKMKAQDERIESQRIIIEEQESIVLELQSQQAATNKALTDIKGELNQIYRVVALRHHVGTGIHVKPHFIL